MSINTVQHERHAGSGQDEVELSGSFVTAGAAAPTVIEGAGFTVSAPVTGVYSITVDRKYPGVKCCIPHLGTTDGSATNDEVHYGGYTAATGVFILTTESAAGTAADLTGPVVHFIIKFVKYSTQL
jgi:hypothetical protein